MASNPKRIMMDPDDRRKALLAEPDIEIVEEYRVFCRPCKKWIVLDRRAPYKYRRWKEHISKEVHLGIPQGTSHWKRKHLTTEQRRQILLDDPHAAKVEERCILCGLCHKWISLQGQPAYCLYRLSEPAPQAQSENLYADIVDYLKSHLSQSDDELRITALAMHELIRLGVLEPLE